jgi:Zn-dependent alcohol dehydrogenase
MGTSTFSQYTVVADVSVVAINPTAPLEKACLLGCGITTAWGAVVKQQGVKDSTVAVFGCGCIGLGVINASTLVGASRIIAIDTNPSKEAWAKKFGATEFVNPTQLPAGKRIQDYLIEITDGGLDFTFDATGNVCPVFISYFPDTEAERVRSTLCVPPSRLAIRDGESRPSLVSPLQGRRSPLVRKLHRSSTPACL